MTSSDPTIICARCGQSRSLVEPFPCPVDGKPCSSVIDAALVSAPKGAEPPASGLLPCPFCGEPPYMNEYEDNGRAQIGCDNNKCPLDVHTRYEKGIGHDLAVAQWNRRASFDTDIHDKRHSPAPLPPVNLKTDPALLARISAAATHGAEPTTMNEEMLKAAIDRFLAWKLPATFRPDCGISFDGRGKDAHGFDKGWPVGTNLFTADEARAMLEHCLASSTTGVDPGAETLSVPREPTEAILRAHLIVWNSGINGANEYGRAAWRAMVDAANAGLREQLATGVDPGADAAKRKAAAQVGVKECYCAACVAARQGETEAARASPPTTGEADLLRDMDAAMSEGRGSEALGWYGALLTRCRASIESLDRTSRGQQYTLSITNRMLIEAIAANASLRDKLAERDAELWRLYAVQHAAWHLLESSEERIHPVHEIAVDMADYDALLDLVGDDHPHPAPDIDIARKAALEDRAARQSAQSAQAAEGGKT